MGKTGNYLIDMHNEGHAATEANSTCSALLSAAEVAKAALDNLANEFTKLKFDSHARSVREYRKVIKMQIIIATQILAKRGI